LIGEIINLALDPMNYFNQPYLLNLLLVITKQIRPLGSEAVFGFKDEEEDNQEVKSFGGVTIP
jgi:hypothetical protein